MKKPILTVLIVIFAAIFCFSGYKVVSYYLESRQQEEEFKELEEILEENLPEEEKNEEKEEFVRSLESYNALHAKNSDMAGWLTIPGTRVCYPVMYTPDRPNYYLRRNFNGQKSTAGVLFIAENCDPVKPSDNVLIYGHNMHNGSMFASIMGYEKKSFYEEHKIIHFDTLTELADYEVIAVFKTTVYDDTGFKYYNFANACSEEEFDRFLDSCRALELYHIDGEAHYGDKLLTLSTCEYSRENGRLVVVAKKITP